MPADFILRRRDWFREGSQGLGQMGEMISPWGERSSNLSKISASMVREPSEQAKRA
jgi:hypothetical protein